MRWKITIEGMDEFGGRDTAEMATRCSSRRQGIAASTAHTATFHASRYRKRKCKVGRTDAALRHRARHARWRMRSGRA